MNVNGFDIFSFDDRSIIDLNPFEIIDNATAPTTSSLDNFATLFEQKEDVASPLEASNSSTCSTPQVVTPPTHDIILISDPVSKKRGRPPKRNKISKKVKPTTETVTTATQAAVLHQGVNEQNPSDQARLTNEVVDLNSMVLRLQHENSALKASAEEVTALYQQINDLKAENTQLRSRYAESLKETRRLGEANWILQIERRRYISNLEERLEFLRAGYSGLEQNTVKIREGINNISGLMK